MQQTNYMLHYKNSNFDTEYVQDWIFYGNKSQNAASFPTTQNDNSLDTINAFFATRSLSLFIYYFFVCFASALFRQLGKHVRLAMQKHKEMIIVFDCFM